MTKKPKLNIAPGKYYKTRGGDTSYVVGCNPLDEDYPWVVVNERQSKWAYTVDSNGIYCKDDTHSDDLIREIKEPKRCRKN